MAGSCGDDFRLFFEFSPDLLCIAGFDGVFTQVNPSWERAFGYSPDKILNRRFLEFVHPDDRKSTEAEMQRLLIESVPGRIENRYRCQDGTYRWLIWNLIAVPSQQRIYAGAREKSAAFVRTQETLNAIVQSAAAAIIALDSGGRVTMWNQGAERIYGWAEAEVLGRPLPYLSEESSQAEFDARAKQVLDGAALPDLSAKRRRKDGGEVEVNLSVAPMRDVRGSVCGHVGIEIDVTEKKLLEAQLLRAQRMNSLGALAGGVAHDLNNILSPVLMGVELLRTKLTDSSSEWVVAAMETSARRGADLARQILTFARGLDGDRAPLEIRHVVRELNSVMHQTFPKGIQIVTNVSSDLYPVSADATQLHQVFLNLCINARDAMGSVGVLTVTAESVVFSAAHAMRRGAKEGAYVSISVTDTGAGMSHETRERIFEPFFTTKTADKGTGLGLSTTIGIVKAHGGFIDVKTAVGRGSTFTVYLPSTARHDAASAAAVAIPMGKGELILVVDDEAAVRNIVEATLEAYNYRVLTAVDGADGVSVFSRNPEVRLVISDNNMPVMDGASLLRAIEKMRPDIRVISSSGGGAIPPQSDVKNFLSKPFTVEELLRKVHEVLSA